MFTILAGCESTAQTQTVKPVEQSIRETVVAENALDLIVRQTIQAIEGTQTALARPPDDAAPSQASQAVLPTPNEASTPAPTQAAPQISAEITSPATRTPRPSAMAPRAATTAAPQAPAAGVSSSSEQAGEAAVFSQGSASQVNPGDLLEQIGSFGIPLVQGPWSINRNPCPVTSIQPKLLILESRLALPYLSILACGVAPGTEVTLQIDSQGGLTAEASGAFDQLFARYWGSYLFTYLPGRPLPPGNYTVSLKFDSTQLQASRAVGVVQSPTLFWLGDGRLLLAGFQPGERVRLALYTRLGKFAAWQDFFVDTSGGLLIRSAFSSTMGYKMYAQGEQSGSTYFLLLASGQPNQAVVTSQAGLNVPTAPAVCPGQPAQQFQVGQSGFVCSGVPDLALRTSADMQAAQVGSLPAGAPFTVLMGFVCANNLTWWRIQSGASTGWAPEAAPVGGEKLTTVMFMCH